MNTKLLCQSSSGANNADIELEDVIKNALLSFDYEIRPYQIEVANLSKSKLRYGSNILISLPPGTGKTLISQIIAFRYIKRLINKNIKALFLLPNNNLLSQHVNFSSWLHSNDLCKSLKLDKNWKGSTKIDHVNDLKTHDFLFTLPRFFESLYFKDDFITTEIFNNIQLIIIDEYDSYSKSILDDEYENTFDFKKDFLRFSSLPFNKKTKFLFISATPIIKTDRKKKNKSIWSLEYNPKPVNIDKSKYSDFIPVAEVIPIGCVNSTVIDEDIEISKNMSSIYNDIHIYLSSRIPDAKKVNKLLSNLDSLLNKRYVIHNKVRIDISSLHPKIRQYQFLKFSRIKIFEDIGGNYLKHLTHYSKLNVLIELLRKELANKRKVVIFIRYIEIAYLIKEKIGSVLSKEAEVVHGSNSENYYITDSLRELHINDFKEGKKSVIIATRDLFGRGFDLPEADAAIFYSPKDNVRTIWQEFLRIRSTKKTPKNTYVLFYQWTKEEYKMYRLLLSMQNHGMNQSSETEYKYIWEYEEEEKKKGNTRFYFCNFLENEHYHFSNFYKKDSNNYFGEENNYTEKVKLFSDQIFKIMKNFNLGQKSYQYFSSKIRRILKSTSLENMQLFS